MATGCKKLFQIKATLTQTIRYQSALLVTESGSADYTFLYRPVKDSRLDADTSISGNEAIENWAVVSIAKSEVPSKKVQTTTPIIFAHAVQNILLFHQSESTINTCGELKVNQYHPSRIQSTASLNRNTFIKKIIHQYLCFFPRLLAQQV